MLARVTSNTFWQILGKAITVIIGLVMTMILTRYLGQAGFGQYSLVIAFVTLFGTFSNWGLNLIVVREASQSKQQTQILSSAILLRLILSLVALAFLVVLIFFLPYSSFLKLALVLGGFLMLALQIKDSFYMVFNLRLKMKNWALSEVLTSMAQLALLFILVASSLNLYSFILVLIVTNLGAASLSFYLAKKIAPKLSFSKPKKLLGFWPRLAKETLPMGAILAFFTLYTNLDRFLLSILPLPASTGAPEAVIGAYSAAYRVNDVLVQPAAYLMNSFLPLMSAAALARPKFNRLFSFAFILILLMAVPALVFTYLLAPWLMALIAPDFAGSVPALRLLVFASFISYFNHLTGYSLVALGRQKTALYYAFIALIINLAANFYAIPRWSFLGSAAATILTEAAILLMTSYLIFKTLKTSSKNGLY